MDWLSRLPAALALACITCLGNARASEPDCSAPAAGTQAERLICEHALLAMGHGRIRAQQQRLLQAGAISQADIAAFLARRDACTTVACLDTVFSQWKQHAAEIQSAGAPASPAGTGRAGGDPPAPPPPRRGEEPAGGRTVPAGPMAALLLALAAVAAVVALVRARRRGARNADKVRAG